MVDKRRYEQIVFLDGSDAEEPLRLLYEEGEDAALEYLMHWHYPGEHDALSIPGYGTSDDIYEKDGYIMSWNTRLGYIGLVYDSHHETTPDLEDMENEFIKIRFDNAGNLIMTAKDEGVDFAQESYDYAMMEYRSIVSAEDEFLEEAIYPLGFEWVRPEDVGALTKAPLIGMDDEVWGYMDYQIKSFIEDLMQGKPAFWTRG